MRDPAPPAIAFRAKARSAARLDPALRQAWAQLGHGNCGGAAASFAHRSRAATCSVPPTDAQKVITAKFRGHSALQTARAHLEKLLQDIDQKKTPRSFTLLALRDQLKMSGSPSDPAFRASAAQALALVKQNLAVHGARDIHRDDAFCAAQSRPAWAWTTPNDNVLHLCPVWFGTCQECQADVVTHEIFHTIGLADVPSPADTAQCLNDANQMAQLVIQLAAGLTDACAKVGAGLRCDRTIARP